MNPEEKEEKKNEVAAYVQKTVEKSEGLSPMSLDVTDDLLVKADHLLKSGLLPESVQTAQGAVVIMQYGRELGFAPMASFSNVFVVNGKPSLAAKATAGLLLRSGIYHKTIQDCEPVYSEEGHHVDTVTTITMSRGPMEETFSFKWSDAVTAGLVKKDVWKKYLRNMMWWRCYSMLADRVAPDLTMGMPDTSVMADVHNVPYELTNTGEIIMK